MTDDALDRIAMIAWQSLQMIDPKVNREEMPGAIKEAIRTALNYRTPDTAPSQSADLIADLEAVVSVLHDERLIVSANTVGQAITTLRAAEAENARLRALIWMAWKEFNAVRARSGSPLTRDGMETVSDTYWSAMTDALAEAAGSTLPWPTDEMKPVLDAIARRALGGSNET